MASTPTAASPPPPSRATLISNREFGLVLTSAAAGKISGNTARANLLGGLVIRAAASQLAVTRNNATLNHGPGIVLAKSLLTTSYTTNTVSQNNGEQMIHDADLSGPVLPAEDIPKATIVPPQALPK